MASLTYFDFDIVILKIILFIGKNNIFSLRTVCGTQ